MSAEVLYVRAGILEQRPTSAVRDALLADAVLNERQKQVLLDIYESFCRENGSHPSGADLSPEVSAPEVSAPAAAAPNGATDPDRQEN